ncbi:MAG: hypothetical protein K8S27_11170 [Candidatus Omnitrophica bacterium]|nr:hypothetical protein [Candidatus Omnitrophota bacterium]
MEMCVVWCMERHARIVFFGVFFSLLFTHKFVFASMFKGQKSSASGGQSIAAQDVRDQQFVRIAEESRAVIPGSMILYPDGRTVDVTCELNYRAIEQVNEQRLTFGTYWVEGYVARSVYCPPCPAQAVCETCLPNHIVVSSDKITLENYDFYTNKEMIIFVDEKYLFNIGEPYIFLIQIINAKSLAQDNVHAKIVYYYSNRKY